MNPNRDAFHLALVIAALFLAFLVVLGIAAWNTRIAFLPLAPKPTPPPAASPSLRFLPFSTFPQFPAFFVFGVVSSSHQHNPAGMPAACGHPAPLGVAAPGFSFLRIARR